MQYFVLTLLLSLVLGFTSSCEVREKNTLLAEEAGLDLKLPSHIDGSPVLGVITEEGNIYLWSDTTGWTIQTLE